MKKRFVTILAVLTALIPGLAMAGPEVNTVCVSHWSGIVSQHDVCPAGTWELDIDANAPVTFERNPWTGILYYFANGVDHPYYTNVVVTGDGSVDVCRRDATGILYQLDECPPGYTEISL